MSCEVPKFLGQHLRNILRSNIHDSKIMHKINNFLNPVDKEGLFCWCFPWPGFSSQTIGNTKKSGFVFKQ